MRLKDPSEASRSKISYERNSNSLIDLDEAEIKYSKIDSYGVQNVTFVHKTNYLRNLKKGFLTFFLIFMMILAIFFLLMALSGLFERDIPCYEQLGYIEEDCEELNCELL